MFGIFTDICEQIIGVYAPETGELLESESRPNVPCRAEIQLNKSADNGEATNDGLLFLPPAYGDIGINDQVVITKKSGVTVSLGPFIITSIQPVARRLLHHYEAEIKRV